MKCTDARKQLVALADGQLAGRQLTDAQDHLQGCAECRSLLQALQSDAELLRLEPAPVLPDALSTRIISRIHKEGHDPLRSSEPGSCPSSRRPRFGSWPLASDFSARRLPLAAALLILAVGLWLGATLGQNLFRNEYEYRQRMVVTECGVLPDGITEGLFGE